MNSYQDDLVLYHHGIKGQKWGVRRYQNSDGSLTSAGKKRYNSTDKSSEAKPKRGLRGLRDRIQEEKQRQLQEQRELQARIDQMNDQEIRNKINRLRLEREYKQLISESAPQVSPSKILESITSTSQNLNTIVTLGNSVMKLAKSVDDRVGKRK